MNALMLLENPSASLAMSRAHEIREETGTDISDALSQAWDEIRGESNPPTTRRRRAVEPKPSMLTLLLIGGAVFVGVWRWRKGTWPWQGLGRRRLARRTVALTNPGDYRELDWGEPNFRTGSSPPVLKVEEPTKPTVIKRGTERVSTIDLIGTTNL